MVTHWVHPSISWMKRVSLPRRNLCRSRIRASIKTAERPISSDGRVSCRIIEALRFCDIWYINYIIDFCILTLHTIPHWFVYTPLSLLSVLISIPAWPILECQHWCTLTRKGSCRSQCPAGCLSMFYKQHPLGNESTFHQTGSCENHRLRSTFGRGYVSSQEGILWFHVNQFGIFNFFIWIPQKSEEKKTWLPRCSASMESAVPDNSAIFALDVTGRYDC